VPDGVWTMRTLTFAKLGQRGILDTTIEAVYSGRDADGALHLAVVVWIADFAPFAGAPATVYQLPTPPLLAEAEYEAAAAFALARLRTGLELDGATVEVGCEKRR